MSTNKTIAFKAIISISETNEKHCGQNCYYALIQAGAYTGFCGLFMQTLNAGTRYKDSPEIKRCSTCCIMQAAQERLSEKLTTKDADTPIQDVHVHFDNLVTTEEDASEDKAKDAEFHMYVNALEEHVRSVAQASEASEWDKRISICQEIAAVLRKRGYDATADYKGSDIIGDVAMALDRAMNS